MKSYIAYSLALHALLLFPLLSSSFSQTQKVYYGFHLMGGNSGFGPGKMEAASGAGAALKEETKKGEKKKAVAKKPRVEKKVVVPAKDKKGKEAERKKDTQAKQKTKGKNEGTGAAPAGRGDSRASKTAAAGGVGTSLEIGGFGPGGGDLMRGFPYPWYVRLVYDRLWRAWETTDASGKSCVIEFTILKDGAVEGIGVEGSSGDFYYDLMARRAVEAASPFPALPEDFKDSSLKVLVRFKLQ